MSESIENLKKATVASLESLKLSTDSLALRISQATQILDEYRVSLFNLNERVTLLTKMLEEKGIMAKDEFGKRWPLHLKNDVGVQGPDGLMDGSVKVVFYGISG
jgi:hypothetical protein